MDITIFIYIHFLQERLHKGSIHDYWPAHLYIRLTILISLKLTVRLVPIFSWFSVLFAIIVGFPLLLYACSRKTLFSCSQRVSVIIVSTITAGLLSIWESGISLSCHFGHCWHPNPFIIQHLDKSKTALPLAMILNNIFIPIDNLPLWLVNYRESVILLKELPYTLTHGCGFGKRGKHSPCQSTQHDIFIL